MANIKDLKKRIRSTKGTLKITSAMKLVSAAKLAKAQNKITSFRPYAEELEKTVRVCAALTEGYSHDFLKSKESKKSALLVISSNKGLCGGYNSGLFKEVKKFVACTDEEIKCFFIGKKVKELLIKSSELKEIKSFEFEKVDPTLQEVTTIADELSSLFVAGEIGKLYVAYNSFISAIQFDSQVKQVLPMTMSTEEKEDLKKSIGVDFKYEPSADSILDSIIPQVYTSTIYASILDAIASEHGSRMAAMDSASTNCKDMIRNLTLKMNKLRQAAITTELTEIVSGAESLNA